MNALRVRRMIAKEVRQLFRDPHADHAFQRQHPAAVFQAFLLDDPAEAGDVVDVRLIRFRKTFRIT